MRFLLVVIVFSPGCYLYAIKQLLIKLQHSNKNGGELSSRYGGHYIVVAAFSPAIVLSGTSANGNYAVINDEAVISQDLMQAFVTQTGREGVKVDKDMLVRALEAIRGNTDISLAGLNLSDYDLTLMFENSVSKGNHKRDFEAA